MLKKGTQEPGRAARHLPVRVVEIVTVGGASAAMYRLQETGDVMVIFYAAIAIVVLTIASAIARAAEDKLDAVFGGRRARATRRGGPDDFGQR